MSNQVRSAAIERIARPILAALFGAAFIAAIFSALAWPLQARTFPLILAVPGAALSLFQLALDLFRSAHKPAADDQAGMMDLAADRSIPTSVVLQRGLVMVAWILGLFLGIALFGLMLMPPLFILAYLLVHTRSWMAPVYAGAFSAIHLWLFHFTLHVAWPVPLIVWPQQGILQIIGT